LSSVSALSVSSFPSPRLPASLEKLEGDVLFQQSKITEVLGGSGYNTDRLATPYIPQFTGNTHLSTCTRTCAQLLLRSVASIRMGDEE
jgi:hypothetical protein